MSLVHEKSSECVISALDLFSVHGTLAVLEEGRWVEHTPVSSYSNNQSPMDFDVKGGDDMYTDLNNTFICLSVKIVKGDGTAFAADQQMKVGPVNLFLQSMFQQIDVKWNDRNVAQSSNHYPHKAYLEILLSYDKTTKESQLTSELFVKDTAGKMDEIADNEGLKERMKFTAGSSTIDLIGRVHCDVFRQEKYLLNKVDMSIKLTRSKPEFVLMSKEGEEDARVEIERASLFVRKIKPSAALLLAHAKALEMGNAKYPNRRTDVKTITIPQGMSTLTRDHLFLGNVPRRVILGCVSNASLNGDYKKKKTYNFQHYHINCLCLYVNGVQIPLKHLQPNFEKEQYV